MHSAKDIHADAGSFDDASRPRVRAENVLARPRHSHRCPPSRSRPLRTKEGLPHLGQRDGPAGPEAREASSSAMAPLSSATSSLFSARVSCMANCDTMSFTAPPSHGSSADPMIGGACFSGGPPMGHPCQRWFNIEALRRGQKMAICESRWLPASFSQSARMRKPSSQHTACRVAFFLVVGRLAYRRLLSTTSGNRAERDFSRWLPSCALSAA